MDKLNYKLCYVDKLDEETYMLWFSKLDLTLVCGDDWNDAPYECNAGEPYEEGNDYAKIVVFKNWNSDLRCPCDGYVNSPYTILDINNRKVVPWLVGNDVVIWAGATLGETINELGGRDDIEIYINREDV